MEYISPRKKHIKIEDFISSENLFVLQKLVEDNCLDRRNISTSMHEFMDLIGLKAKHRRQEQAIKDSIPPEVFQKNE